MAIRVDGGTRKQQQGQHQVSQFEGREPTLKGLIFNYNGEHTPDQYIRTMKEIIT